VFCELLIFRIFQVRDDKRGDLLFKDVMPSAVSAILQGDYRGDGNTEIICCGANGELRAFIMASGEVFQVSCECCVCVCVCVMGFAFPFSLDADGVPELIAGYANGILEVNNSMCVCVRVCVCMCVLNMLSRCLFFF